MRKNGLVLFVLFVFMLFLGCTPQTVNVKNYQINEIRVANVGDPMIKVGKNLYEEMRFIPAVNITERLKNEEFFLPLDPPFDGIYDPQNDAYFVILDRHEIFSVKVDANGKAVASQGHFDKGEKLFDPYPNYYGAKESKIYEISYSGRRDNFITITYKELYVDLNDIKREINELRPGFYEQIVYNLDDSNEIVYKNFRMKIFSASNEKIEFEILSDTANE